MTETPMRRPTIKDVAERAKVSLKTVSRVINNEPSVLQGTRARVLHAIAELDYEPDQSARNLRSGTPFVIGLIYDNPNPYHIIGVQNGVLAACRETGFGLQIHPCDSTSPLLADEVDTLSVITSADRRCAAISKVVRVRVEFSKNTLHTVLPRSNGTFFTARAPTSRNESAVSSISVSSSRRSPSRDRKWRSWP